MIDEEHPQSEDFKDHIDEVEKLWDELLKSMQERRDRLSKSEIAQQVCAKNNVLF